MGILDGQPVNAAITNPAFINKNINDVMPNILGFARALSGASIADIQAAVNKLYTATGASESQTGTVYNATAGTIINGQNYQTSFNILAGKFDPATGHFHTGAAGDGPILPYVHGLAASGNPFLTGDITLIPGTGMIISQSGQEISFYSSPGTTIAASGNAPLTGAVLLVAGSNIVLSQVGQNITIAASGGGGGGSVISFPIANNQSTFSDITGFYVDPTLYKAFAADTSTVRQSTDVVTVVTDAEDTTYYTNLGGFGSTDQVKSISLQADEKALVGGLLTTVNGVGISNFARINNDGSPDTTFNSALGTSFDDQVQTSGVLSDTSIILAGDFLNFNGSSQQYIIKLSASAVVDTPFNTNLGTGFNNSIASIAVQSNDQIVVGGSFTSLNGTTRNRLVRLNSNGTVDTTFSTNMGTAFNNVVNKVYIQPNGQILVGGRFTTFNGGSQIRFLRLNSDGTPDTTFNTNLGTGATGFSASVDAVTIEGTDIFVGGFFTSFNGSLITNLVCLNSNGTLNTTVNTNLGVGAGGNVTSLATQGTDIVVGGNFTTFNGNSADFIARINNAGVFDTAWYATLNPGFNDTVFSVVSQANTQLLIGGLYTTFAGNTRYMLIRYETVMSTTTDYDYVSEDTLNGVYHDLTGVWTVGIFNSTGDSPGVSLQMTNAGQMQYTSTNIPGTLIASEFKFQMVKL